MADSDLRRELAPARRSAAQLELAIAALLGAGAVTIAVIAAVHAVRAPQVFAIALPAPASAPAPIIKTYPLPPIAIALPPVASDPPPARAGASCPPARTDATWVAPHLDEAVTRVEASPTNAGWIAAWNEHHVFVSRDAGATFRRVLDAGRDELVASAAFDCWGRLVVARGAQIGVLDGASERWSRGAALDSEVRVLGGGPDIVAVGVHDSHATLAVSTDGGATWHHQLLGDASPTEMPSRGRQDADGTVHVAYTIGDCDRDLITAFELRGRERSEARSVSYDGASYDLLGDRVIAQALEDDRGEHRFSQLDNSDPIVLANGAQAVMISGAAAYRVRGDSVRAMAVKVIGDAQALDAAGRIWAIADGQPVIAR